MVLKINCNLENCNMGCSGSAEAAKKQNSIVKLKPGERPPKQIALQRYLVY